MPTSAVQSTSLVRIQAILTSLIYDQALRARLVAEPPSADAHDTASTTTASSATAVDNASPVIKTEPSLAGLIADLATSDLANILGGHQFLLVVLDAPLEFALGVGASCIA
jgi:hypothetical protein